jgi:glycosyltransferase involved in cell wall biosynthesis
VVFLSRISRIKNLDGALRILAGVSAEVEFDIYGPRQDAGYWRQCEAAWRTLPQHIRVRYMGVVPADRAVATLGRYDLFLLPTLGENFGHVILESLLAGTPVLVSDRTPWRDLSRAGVGWDIAVEREGAFRDVLESVAGMSGAEWCQWSSRAAAYARHKCSDSRVVEDNRQLLRAALAAGGRD